MTRHHLGIALVAMALGQVPGISRDTAGRPNQRQTTKGTEPQGLARVHAVVTEPTGKFVGGLSKEDFLLKENDADQVLNSVSELRADASSDPRAIVLLVDSAHISSQSLERVRMVLRRFVDEQLDARDSVAIITSAGKPGKEGEFITDREKLKAEMNRMRPGFTRGASFLTPVLCGRVIRRDPQALNLAVLIMNSEERSAGSMQLPSAINPQAEAVSKCQMTLLEAASRRKALISSIGVAIEKLSRMPGQHYIALISEGFTMVDAGGEAAIYEVRPAISSAVRSGTVIYAFDATIPGAAALPGTESYALAAEIHSSKLDLQHGMGLLAGQTGGDAHFSLDSLGNQLQQMLDSNRITYRLEYSSPPINDPRKYRSIGVSVKGHPEYQVRGAKGYDMTDTRPAK